MTEYAVLGGTGQVGGSILDLLLQSPGKTVHAYVRSKRKLYTMRPYLETAANCQIYEGSLDDVDLLVDCIRGTRAVFLAVAASENIPGCTVAQQQAKSIIPALEQLQKEQVGGVLPLVVVLSSASLNDELCMNMPPAAHTILKMSMSHVYDDLRQAEDFLRSHDWIHQVYIKPGGLVHDIQRGHVLSTERQQTFLSFPDLAAGMIEVADEESDKWNSKNVSVLPASAGTGIEWRIPLFLTKGLLWHFLPGTYPYLGQLLP